MGLKTSTQIRIRNVFQIDTKDQSNGKYQMFRNKFLTFLILFLIYSNSHSTASVIIKVKNCTTSNTDSNCGVIENINDDKNASEIQKIESEASENNYRNLSAFEFPESELIKSVHIPPNLQTTTNPTNFTYFESEYEPEYPNDDNVIPVKSTKIHEVTKILNTILTNYDRRIRPDFYGPPVQVAVTIMVRSLASISEVDMEFKIDLYLRQFWNDPRLQFELKPRVEELGLSHEFANQIWQPDTFFPNEKKSYIHSATVLNEFIRLYPNGNVLKSTRLTLTASCPMSLKLFPMDHQICSLEIESYGFSTKSIEYIWGEGKGSLTMGVNSVTLPQFQVLGYRQKKTWARTTTGNYSMLLVEFLFIRSLNYYVSQIYIPAALIVIISWLSLYMGREATAERMALGVTTVLTITTLLLSSNSNSPKISYVKAIDIYLGICFTYVFAALLQSAVVGYLGKKIKEQQRNVEIELKKQKILRRRLKAQERKQRQLKLWQSLTTRSQLNLNEEQQLQNPNELHVPSIPLKIRADYDQGSNFNVKDELDMDAEKSGSPKEITRDTSTIVIDDVNFKEVCGNYGEFGFNEIDDDEEDEEIIIYPGRFGAIRANERILINKAKISMCDVAFRMIFPTGFLLFNLFYWIYYLNVSKLEEMESWTENWYD